MVLFHSNNLIDGYLEVQLERTFDNELGTFWFALPLSTNFTHYPCLLYTSYFLLCAGLMVRLKARKHDNFKCLVELNNTHIKCFQILLRLTWKTLVCVFEWYI